MKGKREGRRDEGRKGGRREEGEGNMLTCAPDVLQEKKSQLASFSTAILIGLAW
jgi:hypothetical protein